MRLLEEKILREKVRNYPISYDKTHKGYTEKVAVENAWNAVSDELEFIENCTKFRLKIEVSNEQSSAKNGVLQSVVASVYLPCNGGMFSFSRF